MLAMRKMRSNELAERIGLTQANLSILKTGKAKEFKTECGSSKQVGMRPRIEHQKGKLSVVLFPNEKPIRLDMAFPRVVAFIT